MKGYLIRNLIPVYTEHGSYEETAHEGSKRPLVEMKFD